MTTEQSDSKDFNEALHIIIDLITDEDFEEFMESGGSVELTT